MQTESNIGILKNEDQCALVPPIGIYSTTIFVSNVWRTIASGGGCGAHLNFAYSRE